MTAGMTAGRTPPELRIGVDTGGTFTDVVLDPGSPHPLLTHKRLSTPDDPARAVLAGLAAILAAWRPEATLEDVETVVHGSTVATNALLEGKGARAAFVTTAGFEDTLHIARQHRPELYALSVARPDPPVTSDCCLGVEERTRFDGSVLRPLAEEAAGRIATQLRTLGVEAVAVSLLHSYANPAHERRLADALRRALPDVHLTVSHELLPEFREYERAATCVANAVVAPPMTRYVGRLADRLGERRLRVMASGGGSVPPEAVARAPVQTILSGPAGGVVGAWGVAEAAGIDGVITFDMGGTSTDVALCAGGPSRTNETELAGLPIRLPIIDIHTVGAGGGSIARVDAGGALQVGPESAGADPGPACYGRQTAPLRATVTDAHVVLGHLSADRPLGGDLRIDADAARQAVAGVAKTAGLSLEAAAEGILRVAEATMARAVQRISVQRGHDPRDFVLLPFGGAGGLHACRLAEALGMREVVVPPHAGLLSALGMLAAAPLYTFSQSVLARSEPTADGYPDPRADASVQAALAVLRTRADAALDADGVAADERRFTPALDLRYAGQAYELTMPLGDADPVAAFVDRHERLYGYTAPERALEIVTVRLRAAGAAPPLRLPERPPRVEGAVPTDAALVWEDRARRTWTRVRAADLRAGDRLDGPLLVTAFSSTTVVPRGWSLEAEAAGTLRLRRD